MFSKTCEYGLRATLFITTESENDKIVSQKDIAQEIDSPIAFTAKILQKLVHHNIIKSVKGAGGGFYIEKGVSRNIKLMQVIQALECDTIITGCGLGLKNCSEEHPCPLHDRFKDIKANLINMFEKTTLYDLSVGVKLGNTFLKQ